MYVLCIQFYSHFGIYRTILLFNTGLHQRNFFRVSFFFLRFPHKKGLLRLLIDVLLCFTLYTQTMSALCPCAISKVKKKAKENQQSCMHKEQGKIENENGIKE